MSENKQALQVAALKNGTVIDHHQKNSLLSYNFWAWSK